ncbi:MAG: uncharacterized protein KVP18_000909 [Porospora cf. gigantea A]|uniref:uncharacterized protein n=1 Tax=Porospora cf. gigantea A TaxID=2853593 RepID=UPI0035599E73|nr:MAG: hypothetical protein KVP18_000909 [Porospora cf. gigantea A]
MPPVERSNKYHMTFVVGKNRPPRPPDPQPAIQVKPMQSISVAKGLQNVFAPEGWDPAKTCVVCNFPTGTDERAALCFLQYLIPISHIEKGPSLGKEVNFLCVLPSDKEIELLLRSSVWFNSGQPIQSRMVDVEPSALDPANIMNAAGEVMAQGQFAVTMVNDMASMFNNMNW